jgi:hypothetical protein
MQADLFTKQLQQALFLKLCNVIMGYNHTATLLSPLSVHEERVEINEHDSAKVKNSDSIHEQNPGIARR